MHKAELLRSTQGAFVEFHNRGRYKGYPDELKAKAAVLLNSYSLREVSKSLGISATSLKKWQRLYGSSSEPKKAPTFIPLSLDDRAPIEKSIPLTLQLPQGFQLLLPEQSIAKTATLIAALTKELALCSI